MFEFLVIVLLLLLAFVSDRITNRIGEIEWRIEQLERSNNNDR